MEMEKTLAVEDFHGKTVDFRIFAGKTFPYAGNFSGKTIDYREYFVNNYSLSKNFRKRRFLRHFSGKNSPDN